MTPIRRTPCTRLGDVVPLRAGPVVRYAASSAVSLVPTTLLVLWLVDNSPSQSKLFWPALLLTVLVAVTPSLVRIWEERFTRLLELLAAHAEDTGWDMASIRRGICRVDAAFWPMNVFTVGFAAAFYLFFATPGLDRLGANDMRGRIAAAIIGSLFAHSVALGLWIVTRLVVLTATALGSAPRWRPFRRRQATGVESISSLAAFTGFMFSVGSLAMPAWIEAGRGAPSGARVFTVSGTIIFLAMGTVAFLIPQIMLLRYVTRAHDTRVNQLAALMEVLADEIATTPIEEAVQPRRHAHLDRLNRLHGAFTAIDSAHQALHRGHLAPATLHTVSRALTTIVLPAGALVVQAITAA